MRRDFSKLKRNSRKAVGALIASLLIIGVVIVIIIAGSFIAYTLPGSLPTTSETYGLPNENYSEYPEVVPNSTNYAAVFIANGASLGPGYVGFDPQNVTVVIGVNNTVVWQNVDNFTQSVLSSNPSFNSGNLTYGQSWNFTYAAPGTYKFTDSPNAWMNGTVTVVS